MKNILGEGRLESGGGKAVGAERGGRAASACLVEVLWVFKCLSSSASWRNASPATYWEFTLNKF